MTLTDKFRGDKPGKWAEDHAERNAVGEQGAETCVLRPTVWVNCGEVREEGETDKQDVGEDAEGDEQLPARESIDYRGAEARGKRQDDLGQCRAPLCHFSGKITFVFDDFFFRKSGKLTLKSQIPTENKSMIEE